MAPQKLLEENTFMTSNKLRKQIHLQSVFLLLIPRLQDADFFQVTGGIQDTNFPFCDIKSVQTKKKRVYTKLRHYYYAHTLRNLFDRRDILRTCNFVVPIHPSEEKVIT